MTKTVSLKELKELLRSDKGLKILFAVGAALILLTAIGGLLPKSGSGDGGKDGCTDFAGYEAALEKRLEDILSKIEGIGEVDVMVTLDTACETEYGRNADMISSVTAPKVRGVAVVCGGGDSITVKEKVINAVAGVLGIGVSHISVTR